MLWLIPSIHDMRCIFVFVVVTAISFLFSYFFIMGRPSDAKTERMQASILIYGSAQSFVGFIGGFFISKVIYSPWMLARDSYAFVKSDDDILSDFN